MKILGIGNAIVDVICKVEESFLDQNNLAKGKVTEPTFEPTSTKIFLSEVFKKLIIL